MKALTLTQPWASLVAQGHKTIETRSWRTSYRGPLVIHAAKGYPRDAQLFASTEAALGRLPHRIPRAAAVAVVEMVACLPTEELNLEISGLERHLGDYGPGRWGWVFDPAKLFVFPEPVPYSGALGLWEFPARMIPTPVLPR